MEQLQSYPEDPDPRLSELLTAQAEFALSQDRGIAERDPNAELEEIARQNPAKALIIRELADKRFPGTGNLMNRLVAQLTLIDAFDHMERIQSQGRATGNELLMMVDSLVEEYGVTQNAPEQEL